MERVTLLLALATTFVATAVTLEPCTGDTRGNKQCNFDSTHRVCATIGLPGTSFWRFTEQGSWCNTRGADQGENGELR